MKTSTCLLVTIPTGSRKILFCGIDFTSKRSSGMPKASRSSFAQNMPSVNTLPLNLSMCCQRCACVLRKRGRFSAVVFNLLEDGEMSDVRSACKLCHPAEEINAKSTCLTSATAERKCPKHRRTHRYVHSTHAWWPFQINVGNPESC